MPGGSVMSSHALIDKRELYSSSAATFQKGASGPDNASAIVVGSGGSPTAENLLHSLFAEARANISGKHLLVPFCLHALDCVEVS